MFFKKERILSTKSEIKEIVNRLWKTKTKGAFLERKKNAGNFCTYLAKRLGKARVVVGVND